MNCPYCGSDDYQKRGFGYNLSQKYQRYQCKVCRRWFSDSNGEISICYREWLKKQYKERKDFYKPNTIILGDRK